MATAGRGQASGLAGSDAAGELIEDAARLAAAFSGEPPPLRMIAKQVGIRRIELSDHLPGEALLVPERRSDGFVAVVRRGESPARQRFSLAHEIGHAMLHTHGIASGVGCEDPSIERLCDRIAAELVVPRRLLDEAEKPLRLQTALDLADRCVASPSTTLMRLVDAEPGLVAVAWETRPRPGSTAKIRVLWSRTRPGIFIPRHATPPVGLKLADLPVRHVHQQRARFRLGSLAGEFEVESVRLRVQQQGSALGPEFFSLIVAGASENAISADRG